MGIDLQFANCKSTVVGIVSRNINYGIMSESEVFTG